MMSLAQPLCTASASKVFLAEELECRMELSNVHANSEVLPLSDSLESEIMKSR